MAGELEGGLLLGAASELFVSADFRVRWESTAGLESGIPPLSVAPSFGKGVTRGGALVTGRVNVV
jgi:hypothetical protein